MPRLLILRFFSRRQGTVRKSLVTKDLGAGASSKSRAELDAEQARLDALRAERKAAATLDRTRALIEVASAIFKRYGEEKAARGILDFDDLIEKTLGFARTLRCALGAL